MAVPGLKVVAPSTPRDVIGLLAAAVRDPDPVLFFEQKSLYADQGRGASDGEIVDELGQAKVITAGQDATILALAAMVPPGVRGRWPARAAARHSTVVSWTCAAWSRSTPGHYPRRGGQDRRLFTVEENPRLCGWGAEIVSIAVEEASAR